jgi:hypothetical protein
MKLNYGRYKKFIIFFLSIILIIISLKNIKIQLTLKNDSNFKKYTKKFLRNIPTNRKNHELLQFLSKNLGYNLTKVKTIYLTCRHNFGNQFMVLNKLIFYCEILGCKKIVLNKTNFWYIKKKIYNRKYKMLIEPRDFVKESFVLYDRTFIFFHYTNVFKPEFKTNLLKKEILRNLPNIEINIDKNDLIIYIRSGDIFIKKNPCIFYAQPPYCFYKQILLNYKYTKKYIISQTTDNPVIKPLLKNFPDIIYHKNSIKVDMLYILKAYNIVVTKSTFLISLIQLNDNINKIYEYDLFFNDSFDQDLNSYNYLKKNYIIYKMNSSMKYKLFMKKWRNTRFQRQLMLYDKCQIYFKKIKK